MPTADGFATTDELAPSTQAYVASQRRAAQEAALVRQETERRQIEMQQHRAALRHSDFQENQEANSQLDHTQAADIAIQVRSPAFRGKSWAQVSRDSPEVPQHYVDAFGETSAAAPKRWNEAQTNETGIVTGTPIAPVTPAQKLKGAALGIPPVQGESGDEYATRMAAHQEAKNTPVGYDDLSDQERAYVDSVAKYQQPSPASRGGMPPAAKARILGALSTQYPDYDAKEYQSRQSALTGFKSGAEAKSITSANTVIGHLKTLSEAASDMHNRGMPIWNAVGNTIQSVTGDPRVVKFEAARNAVASELAKLFKGGNAAPTTKETEEFRNIISPNMSPDQMKGSISQFTDLMGSRLNALQEQWDKGVKGPRTLPFLTPKSREILDQIGQNPDAYDNVGGQSEPTPQIPDAAIQHLRSNPNLAPQFDSKYGTGASAKALGK